MDNPRTFHIGGLDYFRGFRSSTQSPSRLLLLHMKSLCPHYFRYLGSHPPTEGVYRMTFFASYNFELHHIQLKTLFNSDTNIARRC